MLVPKAALMPFTLSIRMHVPCMQASPGAAKTHARAKPPTEATEDAKETEDDQQAASEGSAEDDDADVDDENMVAAMMKVDWRVSSIHI